MSEDVLLRARGLAVAYDRETVLSDVDVELRRGRVTALIGSNGSGKTTLLRALLGLLPARAGSIEYPAGTAPRVGYLPQLDESESLFPVTVLDVVLMGLTPSLGVWRRPARRERDAAMAALARLGIADLADRPFRALSGGQRQRALLARGTVADIDLLVLDEPVRGLDLATAAALVETLVSFARERGIAVLVATHSLDLVANHADDVGLVSDGGVVSGDASEVMTTAALTTFHGRPVTVHEISGQRLVVPGVQTSPDQGSAGVARAGDAAAATSGADDAPALGADDAPDGPGAGPGSGAR